MDVKIKNLHNRLRVTTNDHPLTNSAKCPVCSVHSPLDRLLQPVQRKRRTWQATNICRYKPGNHLPLQFKHPRPLLSFNTTSWRFPTCRQASHMLTANIVFFRSLTSTTAPMSKFTILMAQALKAFFATLRVFP